MVNRPRMEPNPRSLEDLVSGIDAAIASEASPNAIQTLRGEPTRAIAMWRSRSAESCLRRPVPSVQEINRVPPITAVPNVPHGCWV
jgi:hypothetical protein